MMKLNLQLFGASVNITGSDVDASVESNTSYIAGTITIYVNGSTYNNEGSAYYTINGGGRNYFKINRNSSFSASYRLGPYGHNNDGSLGNQTVSVYVHLTNSTSTSNSISVGMQTISRWATMTNATNFNDEQNPTITYNNPARTPLSVWLEPYPTGDHLCVRDNIPNTQGSYTWTLTNDERKQLRAKCNNSNSCTIRLGMYSNLNGNIRASYIDRTFSIVNANPTFSSFNFEDINEKTLALTGNNQNIIIGYSTVKAIIPNANKGIANKEASMFKYRFAIGNQSKDITYSDTEDVETTIDKVSSGTFTMFAIDSRNNSTPVYKNANNIINYEPIKITYLSLSRENGVSGNVTLNFNGTFWNNTFGAVTNNIKSITYNIHNNSSNTDTIGKTTISPTITQGKNEFTFSGAIAGDEEDTTFDINSAYVITLTISDELSSTSQSYTLGTGIPAISIDRNGVGIFCKYDSSIGGYLQVNGTTIMSAKVLFEGDTSGNITLSESSANFDYLEVYFYDNDGRKHSSKIDNPYGQNIGLIAFSAGNSVGYTKLKVYKIDGATMTATQEAELATPSSNGAYNTSGHIHVTKVVGYK